MYTSTKDEEDFADATAKFRELYPGDYQLKEWYDPSVMSWNFKIQFDSEQAEIMFKLKNM